MRKTLVLLIACILAAPAVAAHAFNHASRHEDCDIHGDPLGHAVGDGHVHWHHNEASSAHYHGAILFPAGHTHPDVLHDPCNQVGMHVPDFDNQVGLSETTLYEALQQKEGQRIIVGDEAFVFPGGEDLKVQTDLVVRSDAVLAGMGFPGSGTPSDPYIIEGYHVKNVLLVADTSKCIVVRNNVIHSDGILGGIIDPDDILDREAIVADLLAELEALKELLKARQADVAAAAAAVLAAEEALRDAIAAEDDAEAALAPWDEQMAVYLQERAELAADLTGAQQAAQASKAALDAMQAAVQQQRAVVASAQDTVAKAEAAWEQAVVRHEAAQDAFETFVDEYGEPEPPARSYRDDTGKVAAQLVPTFLEAYDEFASDAAPADEVLYETYREHRARLDAAQNDVYTKQAELDKARHDLGLETAALDKALADASLAAAAHAASELVVDEATRALRATDGAIAAFAAEYEPVRLAEQEAEAQRRIAEALLDEARGNLAAAESLAAQVSDDVAAAQAAYDAALLELAKGAISYLGKEYTSIDEFVEAILAPLRDRLNAAHTGRLVLDWNGQCIHAHNNVVEDLRVNRNNARTGYATGGVLEDNRIYDVGQIRHYDGMFRENEVGDRDHLRSLTDPAVKAPVHDQAINNDGANQGVFWKNIIYGGVDLDFHGHHHGAGMFAPESHYHGSDVRTGYLYNSAGVCSAPAFDYGGDQNLQQQLGLQDDGFEDCMPHHDHRKRWTSVGFQENVVIDPAGPGVRFEDQNHAGDDREANSEDMHELNLPHFHRTLIEIGGNTIVGQLRVDVLNAPGITVWSDDYSEAVKGTAAQETADALEHLGAQRINTHPERNTAWVSLEDNAIYVTGRAQAILVNDATAADRFDVIDNKAFVLQDGWTSGEGAAATLDLLRSAHSEAPKDVAAKIGTGRSGTQTGLEFVRFSDSQAYVCGNEMFGFDRGLRARDKVYTNVLITSCSTNRYPGADPAVDIAYTPVPVPATQPTQPLRSQTDGTIAGPVLDPTYDEVDNVL